MRLYFKITLTTLILLFGANYVSCQNLKDVLPNNKYIQYVGRVDFSNGNPQFSYPGVSIKAAFEGNKVGFIINDLALGDSAHTNYFEVILDDSLRQTIQLKSGKNKFEFSVLSAKPVHTIELFKRTESSVGSCVFLGFLTKNGELVKLQEPNANKIEIIGDSWSCGYGNMRADVNPKQGFNAFNENNYLAWGALLARSLKSQYVCTAYSGRGMYRNSSGNTYGTLPLVYDQTIPDNEQLLWNHQNYIPDLVIIYLGTNDFYPEAWAEPSTLDSASYVQTYISFVKKIKNIHANTKALLLFGNSKSDYWPKGKMHLTRWRNYMHAIYRNLMQDNIKQIYIHELATQKPPYGEDWHPALHTHTSIANEVKDYIVKNIVIK